MDHPKIKDPTEELGENRHYADSHRKIESLITSPYYASILTCIAAAFI